MFSTFFMTHPRRRDQGRTIRLLGEFVLRPPGCAQPASSPPRPLRSTGRPASRRPPSHGARGRATDVPLVGTRYQRSVTRSKPIDDRNSAAPLRRRTFIGIFALRRCSVFAEPRRPPTLSFMSGPDQLTLAGNPEASETPVSECTSAHFGERHRTAPERSHTLSRRFDPYLGCFGPKKGAGRRCAEPWGRDVGPWLHRGPNRTVEVGTLNVGTRPALEVLWCASCEMG
jgi:hypothetical protein